MADPRLVVAEISERVADRKEFMVEEIVELVINKVGVEDGIAAWLLFRCIGAIAVEACHGVVLLLSGFRPHRGALRHGRRTRLSPGRSLRSVPVKRKAEGFRLRKAALAA
jgi:hypothetical protein